MASGTARMLQSDKGKVSALPQAGQCHRRDRVGGMQGERGQTLIDGRNAHLCVMERDCLDFLQEGCIKTPFCLIVWLQQSEDVRK